jgi:hypothetical protein
LRNKWIYKIKYTASGAVEKYKAHLVPKGFTQKQGVDFSETYTPVIRHNSIRAILALVANRGMTLQQFDIGTVFLNGDLLEEIYMVKPEGFKDLQRPNDVCLLRRSLYGLKQSARQWNKKMDRFLKQWKLISNDADSCVYRNKGDLHTLLEIYVDDGIIASLYPKHIDSIITYLETNFKGLKGGMEYFVGFQIERDPFSGSIFIYQTQYIDDIIEWFGKKDAHHVSTYVDTHAKLSNRIDMVDPLFKFLIRKQ